MAAVANAIPESRENVLAIARPPRGIHTVGTPAARKPNRAATAPPNWITETVAALQDRSARWSTRRTWSCIGETKEVRAAVTIRGPITATGKPCHHPTTAAKPDSTAEAALGATPIRSIRGSRSIRR
jgi:hypothetical protein